MPELGVVASRAPACHPHDDDFIAADVKSTGWSIHSGVQQVNDDKLIAISVGSPDPMMYKHYYFGGSTTVSIA
jgi:hypothetical protein